MDGHRIVEIKITPVKSDKLASFHHAIKGRAVALFAGAQRLLRLLALLYIQEKCGETIARGEEPDIQPALGNRRKRLEGHWRAFCHGAAIIFLHRRANKLGENLPDRFSKHFVAAMVKQSFRAVVGKREA